MVKDLYRTLQVPEDADGETIKKAFRKIALSCHPDHHGENPTSEERFKEANHAYAILGNEERRRRYDLYRQLIGNSTRLGFAPPSGSYERMLEDLFLNASWSAFGPGLPWSLDTLARLHPVLDLSASSLKFLRRVYATFREDPLRRQRTRDRFQTVRRALARDARESFRPYLQRQRERARTSAGPRGRREGGAGSRRTGPRRTAEEDIEWTLPLTAQEAESGAWMTISYIRDSRWEHFRLRVPPGARDGMKLRVPNKGGRIEGRSHFGDLYLRVQVAKT